MKTPSGTRVASFVIGLLLAFGVARTGASAALDVVVGDRNVVKNQPLSSCNSKAQSALATVLGKPAEIGDTGEWEGFGATDGSGNSFAAAAIHCWPLDDIGGYLVTFTCASQTPPATESASVICSKLSAAFGGRP